jgi:hypothetical protein
MTEKMAHEQFASERGTIDGNKRLRGAGAAIMY